jgi:hypothetical protein
VGRSIHLICFKDHVMTLSFSFVANLLFIIRFVRGTIPGLNTGFDIDEADRSEMQQCQRTVVASAIFGNYYHVLQFLLPTSCTLAYMYFLRKL